jgi:hypothetical protein
MGRNEQPCRAAHPHGFVFCGPPFLPTEKATMPTEKIRLGDDAVLTANGTVLEDTTDVTVSLTKESKKLRTRRNGKWTSTSPGPKEFKLDWTMLVREGDTAAITLIQAWWNDTIITMQALDIEGGQGPSGDCYIIEATRGEPLGDGISYKFSAEWTSDGGQDEPEWSGVDSGSVPEPEPESSVLVAPTIPASPAGSLTTRTDDNTGIATMSTGHGIVSTDVCDVYWSGGLRRDMVATVSGLAVSLEGGVGDVLPAEDAAIVICVQRSYPFVAIGDNVTSILISATQRSYVQFRDAGGALIWGVELTAGVNYVWPLDYVDNPLGTNTTATVKITNGNSGNASLVSAEMTVTE